MVETVYFNNDFFRQYIYTTGSAHVYRYFEKTYGFANAYTSFHATPYGQSTTKNYDEVATYATQQKANENYVNYAF